MLMLYQIRLICGKNESATCSAAFEKISHVQALVCFDGDENKDLDKKKKVPRKIRSTRLGTIDFQVESALNKQGERVVPEEFQRLVPKGKSFSYDTIWDVTRLHFIEYKQRTEIQKLLPFKISTGAISNLYKEGLAYIRACHEAVSPELKKYYRSSDRPFIILMDGTNEGGAQTHFQIREAYTNNVLLARRISSENQDDIEDMLKEIEDRFGRPDAVISDMAKTGINAVQNRWAGKVPLFICQFHFLRDLGNDMLANYHQNLRKAISSCRLTRTLNRLRECFNQSSQKTVKTDKDYLQAIAMIDWILDYSRELKGQGMPFDLSRKVYYERGNKIHQQITEILNDNNRKYSAKQTKILSRLRNVLKSLFSNSNSVKRYTILDETWNDFMEVRSLFWDDENDKAAPLSRNATIKNIDNTSPEELSKNIEKIIKKFKKKARNMTKSQKIIYIKAAAQLEKYKTKLSNHIIKDETLYPLPRTNNLCEVAFREVKRQLRRTNGKKNLARVMDHTPVEIIFLQNLKDEQYRKIVFGEKEIHEVFAQVPQDTLKQILTGMNSDVTKKNIDPAIKKADFLETIKKHFLKSA